MKEASGVARLGRLICVMNIPTADLKKMSGRQLCRRVWPEWQVMAVAKSDIDDHVVLLHPDGTWRLVTLLGWRRVQHMSGGDTQATNRLDSAQHAIREVYGPSGRPMDFANVLDLATRAQQDDAHNWPQPHTLHLWVAGNLMAGLAQADHPDAQTIPTLIALGMFGDQFATTFTDLLVLRQQRNMQAELAAMIRAVLRKTYTHPSHSIERRERLIGLYLDEIRKGTLLDSWLTVPENLWEATMTKHLPDNMHLRSLTSPGAP